MIIKGEYLHIVSRAGVSSDIANPNAQSRIQFLNRISSVVINDEFANQRKKKESNNCLNDRHVLGPVQIITEATCISEGLSKQYCQRINDGVLCDHVNHKIIPALGHDFYAWTNIIDPTCEEEGIQHRECSTCQYVEDGPVIALGHDIPDQSEWIETDRPTCTEHGIIQGKCQRDDCTHYEEDVGDVPHGHRLGEWYEITPSTYDTQGEERRDCSECDYYQTALLALLDHEPGPHATCTEPQICTNCDEVLVPALGHVPGPEETCITDQICVICNNILNYAIGHEPGPRATCTTDQVCLICDDILVNALDHTFSDWYDNGDGFHIRDCEYCSENELQEHDFSEWLDINDPTCDDEGLQRRICLICQCVEYKNIPTLSHDIPDQSEWIEIKAPTCIEYGIIRGECQYEGCTHYEEGIGAPPHGHLLGEWNEVIPSTYEEQGEERRYCSKCDYYQTSSLPLLDHEPGAHATCTEPQICTNCGKVLVETLGHVPGPEATCIEDQVCTICSDVLNNTIGHTQGPEANCTEDQVCVVCDIELITAFGHDLTDWTEQNAPTCTEIGINIQTCNRVGCDFIDEEYIEILGHDFATEFTIDTEPTCMESGSQSKHCSRCDDKIEVTSIPAIGHSLGEWYDNGDGFHRRDCEHCSEYEESEDEAVVQADEEWLGLEVILGDNEPGDLGYITEDLVLPQVAPGGSTIEWVSSRPEIVSVPFGIVTRPSFTEDDVKVELTATIKRGNVIASVIFELLVFAEEHPCLEGHDFGDWQIKDTLTCVINGIEFRMCSRCGNEEIKETQATEHDFSEWSTSVEPTCTTTGTLRRECHCGEYETEVIPYLGHNLGEWFIETKPTCMNDGVERRDCIKCDYYQTEIFPALGHHLGDWFIVTEATFDTDGLQRRICDRCDHYENAIIPKHNHTPGPEATCTEPQVCLDSGIILVPALGHDFESWFIENDATCTIDGNHRRDCTRCNHFETSSIPTTGHTPGQEATCITAQICTICSEILVQELDHTSVIVTDTEATCLEDGLLLIECEVCKEELTRTIYYATGHTPGPEATCLTDQVCTICDEVIIPATGHAPGEEATCTENQVCLNCNEILVHALGHDFEGDPGCMEPQTCVTCSLVVAGADSHTFEGDWQVEIEPTCDEFGINFRQCVNCDEKEYQNITYLGHDLEEWFVETEPNCLEEGLERRNCSRCTYYQTESIPAVGHHLGDWFIVTEATYDVDGLQRRECEHCDYFEEVPIPKLDHNPGPEATCTEPQVCLDSGVVLVPALGHDFDDWFTENEADCVEPGNHRRNCERCDLYEYSIQKPLGHVPGAEATCTAPQTCTICSVIITPTLDHTSSGAATCTTAEICTVCSIVMNPVTDHTPGPEATCISNQVCTVCYNILNNATGHTPGEEATCTENQVCLDCNEILVYASHIPGPHATCTEPQVCTNCSIIIVAAPVHNPGEEATCITDQICVNCDEVLVTATGHNPGPEATEIEDQICLDCDEILVPKICDHVFGDWYEVTQ